MSDNTAAPTIDLRPVFASMFACSAAMMGFVVLAGPLANRLSLQPWHLGLTVTIAAVFWVMSAQFWGRRSDAIGRRPVIMRGLVLFFAAYLALCLVVAMGLGPGLPPMLALAGLVVTRAALGLGYSALPSAANALIADHYPPQQRPGIMGRFGAGGAIGIVLGPALVAGLATVSLLLPLLLLAVLPFLCLIAVHRYLPHEAPKADAQQNVLSMWDPRLRTTCAIAFAVMLCVGVAQMTVSFVAIDRVGLPPERAAQVAGLALTLVGVCLVISQLTVRKLDWSSERFIIFGSIIAAVGFIGAALTQSTTGLIAWYGIAGFGAGWVFPSVSARAANQVTTQEQGQAAGSISAAQGLGAMVGPLAGTLVYNVNNALPMILAGGIFCLIAVILARKS